MLSLHYNLYRLFRSHSPSSDLSYTLTHTHTHTNVYTATHAPPYHAPTLTSSRPIHVTRASTSRPGHSDSSVSPCCAQTHACTQNDSCQQLDRMIGHKAEWQLRLSVLRANTCMHTKRQLSTAGQNDWAQGRVALSSLRAARKHMHAHKTTAVNSCTE